MFFSGKLQEIVNKCEDEGRASSTSMLVTGHRLKSVVFSKASRVLGQSGVFCSEDGGM